MNVTGVQWRGEDPREGRFGAGGRSRRVRPAVPDHDDDDDIVEVHGESPDETADGLDLIGSSE